MKQYLLSRLREPSTWRGMIGVAGAFGWWVAPPQQAEAILALAMALAGGVGSATADK